MNCNQTLTNLVRDCKDKTNKGGLHTTIWVAERDNVKVTVDDNTGEITDITNSGNWYKYQFAKGAAVLTSEYTFDGETGDKQYCTNTLTINFKKQSAAKRVSLVGLMNSETFVIVKDGNELPTALGVEEYVSCTSGSATTGQARTDANQYVVALSDTTADFPLNIPESVFEALNLED